MGARTLLHPSDKLLRKSTKSSSERERSPSKNAGRHPPGRILVEKKPVDNPPLVEDSQMI
jgi:hypothetical protein